MDSQVSFHQIWSLIHWKILNKIHSDRNFRRSAKKKWREQGEGRKSEPCAHKNGEGLKCFKTFGASFGDTKFCGGRYSLPNTNNKFTPEDRLFARKKKDEAIHFSEALAGC